MMKLAIYTSVLVAGCIAVAHADTNVTVGYPRTPIAVAPATKAQVQRMAANRYTLETNHGGQFVYTVNCTVSTVPGMAARLTGAKVSAAGIRQFLRFYDADGVLEGECQVKYSLEGGK